MGVIGDFSTSFQNLPQHFIYLKKYGYQALLKNGVQKIVQSKISDFWPFLECNFRLLTVMPDFGPEGVIAGHFLIVGV